MHCPKCHEEYTFDEPCACQPSKKATGVQPGPLHVTTGGDDAVPAPLTPTGLDNPFWKV